MTSSDLDRLTAALRRDPALREELQGLAQDREAVLVWAREKGYPISPRDLDTLLASRDELSDEELEQAAGGEDPWSPKP